MKKRCTPLCILFMAGAVIFSANAQSLAQPRGFGDVALFRSALETDGFVVREGALNKADLAELYCAGVLPSGYAYNFDSPYCLYLMPELPQQAEPVNGHNMFPWTFHMRADEAIVFLGWTPPRVKYFGYQTYLASKFHPLYQMELRFFINVGDAINNFTIRTGDGPGGEPRTGPYDAATMIISTPDSGIAARVQDAALAAGCAESIINIEVIPSQLVQFGLDRKSNQLAFVNRVAFFEDDPDHHIKNAYYARDLPLINPDGTLIAPPYTGNHRGHVFRVTPAAALESSALKPFTMPHLRVRGTGDTREFDLLPALETLRSAIIEHFLDPATMEYEDVPTSIWIPDGYDQYQQQVYFTLGPCRDTIYLRCQGFELSQDSTDFVIVYGLNHARTGKATYSSMVLYGEDAVAGVNPAADVGELVGVASINSEQSGDKGMRGSTQRFASILEQAVPNPTEDLDKFYMCKITRDKTGEPYTMTVPDPLCPRLHLTKLLVGFRAYVEPQTKVSPEWSEIVYDRVLHFRPKKELRVNESGMMPGHFALSQNYPNPANSQTLIDYTVQARCEATLEISNVLGQRVARYVVVAEPQRVNRFVIDGEGFSSGVYFYRLQAGSQVAVKKMHWLR